MVELILAVMETMPRHHTDVSTAHYRPIAQAIAAATQRPEEIAMLLSQGWHESGFAAYVSEGRCLEGPRDARCDPDKKTGLPRARSPWQVWSWCAKAWGPPEGSVAAMTGAAHCVLGKYRMGYRRCGTFEGGFAVMRRNQCESAAAPRRVATMMRLVDKLRKRL